MIVVSSGKKFYMVAQESIAFSEHAAQFIGQKVAVLAARYQYRGKLAEVGTDYLVLSNATAVETSGTSSAAQPQVEDAIGGSVTIKIDAIELLYQPNWSKAPLPGEERE